MSPVPGTTCISRKSPPGPLFGPA